MDKKKNGVDIFTDDYDFGKITTISVTNAEGAKAVHNPIGNYITLQSEYLRFAGLDARHEIARALSERLSRLITADDAASVLVVGLGNIDLAVDSLGPKVAKKIYVTNHLIDELKRQGEDRIRPVSVFAPGVTGNNGIETRELVKAVCEKVKPALVIVVDALAAEALERLNTTIQIADTGLSPGAGMSCGAKKGALNKVYLGVPVIAIGAPTVIDVVTLVNGVIGLTVPPDERSGRNYIETLMSSADGSGKRRNKSMRQLLLDDYGLSLVAPKGVDEITDSLADIIASAINMALHKGLTPDHLRQNM